MTRVPPTPGMGYPLPSKHSRGTPHPIEVIIFHYLLKWLFHSLETFDWHQNCACDWSYRKKFYIFLLHLTSISLLAAKVMLEELCHVIISAWNLKNLLQRKMQSNDYPIDNIVLLVTGRITLQNMNNSTKASWEYLDNLIVCPSIFYESPQQSGLHT